MKLYKKVIVLLLVAVLSGCAQVKQYTAYSVYPIGYLLNRIGGTRINTIQIQDPNLIVENAVVVDNFEEIINDSIFLFHISDLEPYLSIYNDEITLSGVNNVDLSLLNAIYKFQRYTRFTSGDSETYIESPYYDGDCFNVIDTYDFDPFLWLDPSGMLSMAKDVYSTLSNNYVEQSSYFKDNYNNLYSELTTLEASYQNLSTKCKKNNVTIKFSCMTPSFGAWQKSYGFAVYPICLSKYGTLPTSEQLTIIKERLIADKVEYIAYEPNMSQEMSNLFEELVSELNLKRVNLSNISSLTKTQQEDNKDYFSLMYENLNVLDGIYKETLENKINNENTSD